MKKRLIAVLMCLVMILTVTGCGRKTDWPEEYDLKEKEVMVPDRYSYMSEDWDEEEIAMRREIAVWMADCLRRGEEITVPEEYHDIQDDILCSNIEDGRMIVAFDPMSPHSAGHHMSLLLRSIDNGKTWDDLPPLFYYMSNHFTGIRILDGRVYTSMDMGNYDVPQMWCSEDFAESFSVYSTRELAPGYSDEFISDFSELRLGGADEQGDMVVCLLDPDGVLFPDKGKRASLYKFGLIAVSVDMDAKKTSVILANCGENTGS